MAAKQTKFRVAAAHAAPVFMNKVATIRKTVTLIEQAAEENVKVLVFPETFIPGYPVSERPTNVLTHGVCVCRKCHVLIRPVVLGRMLCSSETG